LFDDSQENRPALFDSAARLREGKGGGRRHLSPDRSNQDPKGRALGSAAIACGKKGREIPTLIA